MNIGRCDVRGKYGDPLSRAYFCKTSTKTGGLSNSCAEPFKQGDNEIEHSAPQAGIDFNDASERRTVIWLDDEAKSQRPHSNFRVDRFRAHHKCSVFSATGLMLFFRRLLRRAGSFSAPQASQRGM